MASTKPARACRRAATCMKVWRILTLSMSGHPHDHHDRDRQREPG
jgi:hypothetical protein